MSGVTGDIKKLFNFKYKTRNDSITDQYNRVYMMKALLVAAFLTGMKWYKDEVKCVIPKLMDHTNLASSYASQACWINGFYIFKELRHIPSWTGYYGLPGDARQNGTSIENHLPCALKPFDSNCKPMTKLFYLQYQWFPFYLAALALFYYIPYIFFRYVNNDLITLKKCIKSQNPDLDDINNNYFNSTINPTTHQGARIFANVLVKMSYLLVNILCFLFTDQLLNGDFKRFGTNWINWSKARNSVAHNYVGRRTLIKPGEQLLPTFGFCDIIEVSMDKVLTSENSVTTVCELSQHVLYHYVLIALWFLLIFGMIISVIGIVGLLLEYVFRMYMFGKSEIAAQRVFSSLTIRQGEYLDFIRKKNVQFYGELIRKLYRERFECDSGSEVSSTVKSENDMHFVDPVCI